MTLFSINNNIETEQNRTISTIPYLSKVYIVSFSVKPNAFVMGRYTSVLHFTTGGNFGAMGMHIPAVWFWNDKLHIANGVNGHPNYWINTPKLAKDQWSDVIIINTKVGESFIYEILLNGKLVHRTTNTTPREYKNVRVYATDPWYPKFQGELQNLLVTTPGMFRFRFSYFYCFVATIGKAFFTCQAWNKEKSCRGLITQRLKFETNATIARNLLHI